MSRYLFVTAALPPERGGGAEGYAVELATRLRARGVDVDLLGRNPGGWSDLVEVVDDVSWIRVASPVHAYFGYLVGLTRWLRANAARYSLIQFFDLNAVSAVGLASTSGGHVARVVRDEGVAEWALEQLGDTGVPGLAAWARRWLLRSDRYVVVSSSEVDELVRMGVPREAVSFVPNGVDTDRYEYSRPVANPVIVCPARLRPEKNHLHLLDVFARVVHAHPNAKLILPGDGPCAEAIAGRVSELGLDRSVEMPGHVADMRGLYASCRLVVLLSEAEGPSLGILEAAACGRPAVVSDVGGLIDSVVEGETGFRVEAGNVEAAVHAICRMLEDDGLCEQMGEAAALFVRRERSLEKAVETYAAYLAGVENATGRSGTPQARGR